MASLQSRLSDLITAIGADIKSLTNKALGGPELIYRYTVTGADKASIDTGVDAADAGSNDWTNGDVLEIFTYMRTDEVIVQSNINMTLNNDSSSIYDRLLLQTVNTTTTATQALAAAFWTLLGAGASCASGVFAVSEMRIPNYRSTVGNKHAVEHAGLADSTAANIRQMHFTRGYRSTSAISRVAITPATSGKKFKVGTQILIYKRRAS